MIALHRVFTNVRTALAALIAAGVLSTPAQAWIHDRNADRIDDRIERVNAKGYAAAFVNDDPSQKLGFGVTNGAELTYAIYVRYDRPTGTADSHALSAVGVPWVRPYLYIPYFRTEASFAQIQAISLLPGVARIEVVSVLYPSSHIGSRVVRARDSRGYVKSQDYALFPSAREELGLDGTGVVVAIFDSGVNDDTDTITDYPGHESLHGKFLGGGEFFYGNPLLNTPNTGSVNPQDHGAEASSYHATHVAGIAIGTGGPGGTFAGVAPAARLIDCKVLSDAGASVSGLPEAVEWCLFNKDKLWPGLAGADTIYRGVDVINMSLGDVLSSDGTEADAQAVNAAVRGGLIVVAASGNLGLTGWVASPSSADSSICVGASAHSKSLDRGDDQVTSFSQEGQRADDGDADHYDEMKPTLVAPGNGIISADGDPTTDGRSYKSLSGTSMASPHVAGCVALLLQADPSLTALEVRAILQNTAEHNIGNEKGDRPNDPFGLDPNYDPGSGWGLVDVYAAAQEVLNADAGVQITQVLKPIARVADQAVDVRWITQREYTFLGFHIERARDQDGVPGNFVGINPQLVPPAGDPFIEGDDNRTSYLYVDTDPQLMPGTRYWYRVAWVDLSNQPHREPPVPVDYGAGARVATAYYSIVHDAPDSDLEIKVGVSSSYDPQSPDFVTLGPGVASQDSSQIAIIDFIYVPPGHIRHFWSIGFTASDGVIPHLPPNAAQPWFLDVTEGGFADQSGRLESFSVFVNSSPGSSSGTTYVTNSMTPRPTVEGMHATLWIPEQNPLAVQVASFTAVAEPAGVHLTLLLAMPVEGATAQAFRSTSDDFATRRPLTERLLMSNSQFEHLDATAERGARYFYWVIVEEPGGRTSVSGPIAGTAASTLALATEFAPPAPNPMAGGGVFHYRIGADVAGGGPIEVSLALYDAHGRMIRQIKRGRDAAGAHRITWDGRDSGGAPARAGNYFARFNAGSVTRVARISVVR